MAVRHIQSPQEVYAERAQRAAGREMGAPQPASDDVPRVGDIWDLRGDVLVVQRPDGTRLHQPAAPVSLTERGTWLAVEIADGVRRSRQTTVRDPLR